MMATIILQISSDLFATILAEWIEQKAVTRLDSAMCSRQNRGRFLELLREVCFKSINLDSISGMWVFTRNIRSYHVSIHFKDMPKSVMFDTAFDRWVEISVDSIDSMLIEYDRIWRDRIENLVRCAHKLQSISFHLVYELSAAFVSYILGRQTITDLQFDSCSLGHQYYQHKEEFRVGQHMIKLSSVSAVDLCSSLTGCTVPFNNLVALHLSGRYLDDQQVIKWSELCPNVRHFGFPWNSYPILQPDTMVVALGNFKNLRSLSLCLNDDTTNAVLEAIAANHGHSLHTLELHEMVQRPDSFNLNIQTFMESCTSLHTLHFTTFGGNRICKLLSYTQKNVTTIYIDSKYDSGLLQTIASHCQHLLVLGLQIEELETFEEGLDAVLTQCTQLQTMYLDLNMVPRLYIKALQAYRPQIKFVHTHAPKFDVTSFPID
jgi:hypothetical protein